MGVVGSYTYPRKKQQIAWMEVVGNYTQKEKGTRLSALVEQGGIEPLTFSKSRSLLRLGVAPADWDGLPEPWKQKDGCFQTKRMITPQAKRRW